MSDIGDEPRAGPPREDVRSRVAQWLSSEGYPTEFETAAAFRRHGFRVFQGYHVRDTADAAPREIDVLAVADAHRPGGPLIRCEFVVERKWSKDKPWVIFTSRSGHMAPTACIAQTISSSLGSAAAWTLAPEEECHAMKVFRTPASPGFGGRQAFSKGNDLFYSSLRSVTNASVQLMREYDRGRRRNILPESCVIAFPMLVVDGELFKASFSEERGEMEIEPASDVRCHWRGAPSWDFHATIELVTLRSLDGFLAARRDEVSRLLELMSVTSRDIATCFKTRSLDALTAKRAARGIRGLHPLLREATATTSE
jgi:hypothetical protein